MNAEKKFLMHDDVGVDTIFRKIPVLEEKIEVKYAKITGYFENQDGGHFQSYKKWKHPLFT